MKGKQTINIEQGLIPIKEESNRGIKCKISKENKAETWIRLSRQQYTCACKMHVCPSLLKNPSPETQQA